MSTRSMCCVVTLLMVGLAFGAPQSALAQSTIAASHQVSATSTSSLPSDAQGPISAALGKDDAGYWFHAGSNGSHAENPQHALAMNFTREGVQVRSHDARWELATRAYGYGDALHAVRLAAPETNANRVEYLRGSLTEWYANGPLGLEQGFTLARPPGKANAQPLTLELALTGDLVASLEPDRTSLTLSQKDGHAVLRYTGLTARDAAGRQLPSWLEMKSGRLLLRVNDRGARYPLVIDPWVQQAELTASDGAAGDYLGLSVAVSGTTAVVGAPLRTVGPNYEQGAAYVFVQSGNTWMQQAELTASDGAAYELFGLSVAVNGSTAVVGARYHTVGSNSLQGSAYVFVQSGNTWTQQAELIASDGAAYDNFGNSVTVSGSTIMAGAPGHTVDSNSGQGAVYVFVQSDSTWSQQVELTSSDGAAGDYFGYSVALNGNTAVVGASGHEVGLNLGQGAAYIFALNENTWSQQAELTALDGGPSDDFGYSVAVSGNTAIVGAIWHTVGPNEDQGAAYIFVQADGTWAQQAELTSADGTPNDNFGSSVAISGSTALVGAPYHAVASNSNQGAAYVFVQSDVLWTQEQELTSLDGASGDNHGISVSVDGSAAVVGAPFHQVGGNEDQGAAYLFVQPTPGIYDPGSGSTLTGNTVTFNWNPYPGSTAYWLDVGTTPGGNNYAQSGSLSSSTSSYTVNGLPSDGSPVYVTWWYTLGGQWQNIEYSYTAVGSAVQKGVLTSPSPGSTFTGSTVSFTWTAGIGATAYWLDAGSTMGGNQYYQSGNLGDVLTTSVSGLPTNGSTVYVTLYSLIGGKWLSNQYTYTAFNAASALGVMKTPTPGSTLYGNLATFTWSAGSGATAYWLDAGSTTGGNDYYQSGNLGNVLTTTTSSLPANGSTVYVTLWSYVGGQWFYNEYTYTSGP